MSKSKTFYALYKNNELKGYLLASLHSFITQHDYDTVQKAVAPYVQNCRSFIFEIDPQKPYTQIPFGIERAIFELLEEKTDTSMYYLDELSFQNAMLSTRLWVGASIVTLPWHSYNILRKYGSFLHILNKIIIFFVTRYNIFYNIFTGNKQSIVAQEFQSEQKVIVDTIIRNYRNDEMAELSEEDQKNLFLQERHEDWIPFLRENEFEEPFFITVSAGHMPGKYGLVSLLTQEGYELKALPLIKKDTE